MNLGALAAAIKKSNATLVTKNDLSAEEKLELKRKRRAELAADKLRREEIQAAILLQSIFRGKIYKRQAQKLRERKEFIETQATKYGKTKKYVSMLLRSVDSTDTLKFKYGYDDTIKLLQNTAIDQSYTTCRFNHQKQITEKNKRLMNLHVFCIFVNTNFTQTG